MRPEEAVGEGKYCCIEQLGSLERSEVAYVVENDEAGVGDGAGEICCVLVLDEFVVFSVDDCDWNGDIFEIVDGVVGLRLLHGGEVFDEL